MSSATVQPDAHDELFETVIVPHDLTPYSDRSLPLVRHLARQGQVAAHLVTTASPGVDTSADRKELAARVRRLHGWPASMMSSPPTSLPMRSSSSPRTSRTR
jgi:hypothetical protein